MIKDTFLSFVHLCPFTPVLRPSVTVHLVPAPGEAHDCCRWWILYAQTQAQAQAQAFRMQMMQMEIMRLQAIQQAQQAQQTS